jgi:hypothetical protein
VCVCVVCVVCVVLCVVWCVGVCVCVYRQRQHTERTTFIVCVY